MTKEEVENLTHKFETLFKTYLEDLKNKNEKSPIIHSYLKNMANEYRKTNSDTRIVIDYIAGMTDDYFLREYERITKS